MRTFATCVALAMMVSACGDSATSPSVMNVEGHYTLGGTINGFPSSDITGSISVTNQNVTTATIVQTINFRTNGQTFYTLYTEQPTTASVSSSGDLSWSFAAEGTTLTLSGQFSGNTINGTWNWTGSGESLAGAFSATR